MVKFRGYTGLRANGKWQIDNLLTYAEGAMCCLGRRNWL